jgi:hypothetical protein
MGTRYPKHHDRSHSNGEFADDSASDLAAILSAGCFLYSVQIWPDFQERWDAVELTYIAGSAIVPEISKQAILVQCDIMEELRGTTKEKYATVQLYENLVARFQRSSYP